MVNDACEIDSPEPEWLDQPALMRAPVSTPVLLDRFSFVNEGKPYAERVKPFNFLLSATVRGDRWPAGAAKNGGFHPVAPFSSDPSEWMEMEWADLHTGDVYRLKAHGDTTDASVRVQTFRDVFEHYLHHPEPKSSDASGNPSGKRSRGLLGRVHVQASLIQHIGKESNLLEEQEHGTVDHDPQTVFRTGAELAALRAWLHRVLIAEVSRLSGISERMLRAIRNGERNPAPDKLAAIEWSLAVLSNGVPTSSPPKA